MLRAARHVRTALLVTLFVGFGAAPAVASWDVYLCTGMGTRHVGHPCCASAARDTLPPLRWSPHPCCVLESDGAEAPATSLPAPVAAVGAPPMVALLLPTERPTRATQTPVATRSRAPPDRLFLRHSSLLL